MNNTDFGLSKEQLEKAERRVLIYSIMNTLSEEQKSQIENGDEIRYSLLTQEQKDNVDDALAFEYTLKRLGNHVSDKIQKCL